MTSSSLDSCLALVRHAIVVFRPGDDPQVKNSGDELTQGVVTTYTDDLLIAGRQHHVYALLAKYVMKRLDLSQK